MSAPVETYQVEWELDQLLDIVEKISPERILEVGCYAGGTLWEWMRIADDVTAIDDAMRNADEWNEWAPMFHTTLHTIQGDSRHPDIIQAAAEHGPYDFVFIDGDHHEDTVRADVDNYGAMVAPGGILALHDILPRPGYGVSIVWNELKTESGARYVEIAKNAVEPGNDGPCGIGVLWM